MKATAAAIAGLFAAGAVAAPSAHNHHEHLHRRHAEAEPQDVEYVTQINTQTTVQYVDANGQPVNYQAPAPTPAPAAPAPQDDSQGGTFATSVTADNGQLVQAEAWHFYGDNGEQGISWRYTQPAGNSQPTQAPAPQNYQPAPSSQQAAAPSPAPSSAPAQQPKPAPASTPAAAPASSASSASAPVNSGSSQWQQTIIQAHNVHRANHSVSDLSWHDGLAQAAQMVANKCSFTHDLDTGKDVCGFDSYGQNFACTSGQDNPGQDVTSEWYNEEGIYELSGSYGQANPNTYTIGGSEAETGHFTQLVWKATTHVGCAVANCPNGVAGTSGMKSLFVCDYGPEGNMGGEYATNVPRPNGEPSTTGSEAPQGYGS